jgi:hypothetical protein
MNEGDGKRVTIHPRLHWYLGLNDNAVYSGFLYIRGKLSVFEKQCVTLAYEKGGHHGVV